ncbi:hypothetical protein, partial [Escherichia coli]|uniref:hypothetical protein n=1 Tax=Escherichia coli TaxID=562 RepID=UPI0013D7E361
VQAMREQNHEPAPRCLYSPEDIKRMRIKFDQTCEELGLFCEDVAARAAVGRAVVRAFATGLAEAPAPPSSMVVRFEGEEEVVRILTG